MGVCHFLPVRFHYNGEFMRNSNGLFYVGGTQAMSYIDRDKLSLAEVFFLKN
jgi:alpha-galactosidase